HDADAFRELLKEVQMAGLELIQRGKRNYGLYVILENNGECDKASGSGLEQNRIDSDGIFGHFRHENAAAVKCALPDKAVAWRQPRGMGIAVIVGVFCQQSKPAVVLVRLVDEHLMVPHERHKLGQEQAAYGRQIALAL